MTLDKNNSIARQSDYTRALAATRDQCEFHNRHARLQCYVKLKRTVPAFGSRQILQIF